MLVKEDRTSERSAELEGLDAEGLDAKGLDAEGLDAEDLDAEDPDPEELDAGAFDAEDAAAVEELEELVVIYVEEGPLEDVLDCDCCAGELVACD